MVIDYLYTFGACVRPCEANTVFVVDAYAVLPFSVPLKRFEPVSRRYAQVLQASRDFQLPQLPACHSLERLELWNSVPCRNRLGSLVFEGNYHMEIITYCVINVKRYYRAIAGLNARIVQSSRVTFSPPSQKTMLMFVAAKIEAA